MRNLSYDAANRLTTETWVVGGTTVNTLSFSYDGVGNLLTAANYNGTYTLSYDALDRVTMAQEPFAGTLTPFTVVSILFYRRVPHLLPAMCRSRAATSTKARLPLRERAHHPRPALDLPV